MPVPGRLTRKGGLVHENAASWVRLAFARPVVRRAVKYAVIVGAILIAINHGDAILRGDLPAGRLARMLLTVAVPYVVSTLSSVEATRHRRAEAGAPPSASDPPAGS
jgi:uncharacterized SAM-binding protein YcdF (DUF218 family)